MIASIAHKGGVGMAEWYDKAIIYQIYPKSFQDSNGDGIGDLQGIIQRIPYLQQLGINAVWLNPIFVSPQIDNGYDVANYFAIEPTLGTMEDMEALIKAFHKAGIKLILDFVLNHTSDQHPWFLDAAKNPDSIYRDYYMFAGHDGQKPNNWGSFFGGSVWADDPAGTGASYFHLFDKRMPDLNWQNPEVRHAMGDIAEFWLAKGIDGLRLDAFIHVAKADLRQNYPLAAGQQVPVVAEPFFANLPNVKTWLQPFSQRIKQQFPHAFLLGEAASANVNLAVTYTEKANQLMDSVITFRYFTEDESHLDPAISGQFQPKPLDVTAFKQTQVVWQQTLAAVSKPTLYWNNHDMARVATRYVTAGEAHDVQAKSLAMMMYLQRGIPIIYYGEELGMQNLQFSQIDQFNDQAATDFTQQAQVAGYSEADALHMLSQTHKLPARGGMQWDESAHAGFTTGTPWVDGAFDATINVETEQQNANSLLRFYQNLIALKKSPVFTEGDYYLLDTDDSSYVYQRHLDKQTMIVAVNLSATTSTITLPTGHYRATLTAGQHEINDNQLTLSAYAGCVIERMD